MALERELPATEMKLLPPSSIGERHLFERMVARQQYEKRYDHTGNDVLRDAAARGDTRVITESGRVPELEVPNEAILETFHSLHSRLARGIFLETLPDENERLVMTQKFSDIGANLTSHFPVIYGTSGTETNIKEMAGVIGMAQEISDGGKPVLPIYFVEDQGHPVFDTLRQEAAMLSTFVGSSRNVTPEKAREIVTHALTQLYPQPVELTLYKPDYQAVVCATETIDPESAQVVQAHFESLSTAEKTNNLSVSAVGVPAPTPQALYEYHALGFPQRLTDLMVRISEQLYQSEELRGQPNIADFRTTLQGVLGLQMAYKVYGADMPVFTVGTWGEVSKRLHALDGLTVGDAKKLLQQAYPDEDKRVVNFACPKCRTEHSIAASGDTGKTDCGFANFAQAADGIALNNWVWGGNSGVMYYEAFRKMSEQGQFGLLMDNYEADGPQTRLTTTNHNILLLPPNNRTWVVTRYALHKRQGGLDENASLGLTPPAELVAAYMDSLDDATQKELLAQLFKVSGQIGLSNNSAALYLDHGYAEIQKLPYDLLRSWKETGNEASYVVNPETTVLDQLQRGDLGEEVALTFREHAEQVERVYAYIEMTKNRLRGVQITAEGLLQRLEPLNNAFVELRAQFTPLRNLLTVQIALTQRDRLIARIGFLAKNDPKQCELFTTLCEHLTRGDEEALSANQDMVNRLQAEVADIQAEDVVLGTRAIRAKPINSREKEALSEAEVAAGNQPRTKGQIKTEMKTRFDAEIQRRLKSCTEYQEHLRVMQLLREENDASRLQAAASELKLEERRLIAQLKRLESIAQALSSTEQQMIWEALTRSTIDNARLFSTTGIGNGDSR